MAGIRGGYWRGTTPVPSLLEEGNSTDAAAGQGEMLVTDALPVSGAQGCGSPPFSKKGPGWVCVRKHSFLQTNGRNGDYPKMEKDRSGDIREDV